DECPCRFEVDEHPVAYRVDGGDPAGCAVDEVARLLADRERAARFLRPNHHQRRFVEDYALVGGSDDGVGCSEIDTESAHVGLRKSPAGLVPMMWCRGVRGMGCPKVTAVE